MIRQAWVNGEFDGRVSVYDLGWLAGLGVFETIGVFDGHLPLWRQHLERLEQGAGVLGIPWQPRDDLSAAAGALLDRNRGDDILRITLTAGVEQNGPTWCLTTRARPRSATEAPMQLVVHESRRSADAALAAVKCTSYAFHSIARRAATATAATAARGAVDALLLDDRDRVAETTTCNVFGVRGDRIFTPACRGQFLPGVGRAVLIERLVELGVTVDECDIDLAELRASEVIFTTNAVYGPRLARLAGGPAAFSLPTAVSDAWRAAVVSSDRLD